jgi:SH3-like domain-containing protein
MLRRLLLLLLVVSAFSVPSATSAQDRETPYWASIRADEVNMRVGPSENYPIDWVYKRRNLPVKVVRLMQGWRLVRDPDGAEGWIVARLLSPDRSAMVIGQGLAPMHDGPGAATALRWNAEPGVVGMLGNCENGWCAFDVDGRKGWIEARRLWGAGEP